MPARITLQRISFAAIALAALAGLSGCGLVVVGGTAATTAVVATDRRTAGEQVEDQAIEMKSAAEMRRLFEDRARVNTTSYAGMVLLTGDVPTPADKQKAGEAAGNIEKVRRVINELRVGDITPVSVRTNDTWLTSKVKANLVNTKDVPSRTMIVTTERGIVYLLGKVTAAESERAGKVAASVGGVNKVVKLFEIVSPESVAQPTSPAPVEEAASGSKPASQSDAGGAQAMPVQ